MDVKHLEDALNTAYPNKDSRFYIRSVDVEHSIQYSKHYTKVEIEAYSNRSDVREWFYSSLTAFAKRYSFQVKQIDYNTLGIGDFAQMRATIIF